jgi:hypothetical protein
VDCERSEAQPPAEPKGFGLGCLLKREAVPQAWCDSSPPALVMNTHGAEFLHWGPQGEPDTRTSLFKYLHRLEEIGILVAPGLANSHFPTGRASKCSLSGGHVLPANTVFLYVTSQFPYCQYIIYIIKVQFRYVLAFQDTANRQKFGIA